jgi:hypothetical protein
MGKVYPNSTPDSPLPRGVSHRKPIDAAKDAVRVIDLAERLCRPGGLRPVGQEWVGRCPLPHHEDRSPSFTVNLGKNVWFCHGCLYGGDVVRLYQLAKGFSERESGIAAAQLLLEFGHQPPQRPPAWFRKQERKRRARDAIEDALLRRHQRRIFAILWRQIGQEVTEAERQTEIKTVWGEALRIARLLLAERRS